MKTKKNENNIKSNVVFLCHDGKGNFLMSRRGSNARDNHGLWDPGSGEIHFGETSTQALQRELLEEYGVDAVAQILLGVRENVSETSHWITFEYLVRVNRDQVHNKEPHKLIELEWFQLNQLPVDHAHPLFRLLVEEHKQILVKESERSVNSS